MLFAIVPRPHSLKQQQLHYLTVLLSLYLCLRSHHLRPRLPPPPRLLRRQRLLLTLQRPTLLLLLLLLHHHHLHHPPSLPSLLSLLPPLAPLPPLVHLVHLAHHLVHHLAPHHHLHYPIFPTCPLFLKSLHKQPVPSHLLCLPFYPPTYPFPPRLTRNLLLPHLPSSMASPPLCLQSRPSPPELPIISSRTRAPLDSKHLHLVFLTFDLLLLLLALQLGLLTQVASSPTRLIK